MKKLMYWATALSLMLLLGCGERSTFNRAKKLKTINAYEEYLATNPNGKYRNAAVDSIDALIKHDVLAYLGYIDGRSDIERICSADLSGMYLSAQVTMDMGTKYLDLYCDEKMAISGEVGKGVGVLFLDDSLSIAYKSGMITQLKNRDRKYYQKCKESVELIKKSGLTFATTVNGVNASRTYYSGAINIE